MADSSQSKNIWGLLNPQQSFFVGLVGGVMLLCTVGFFLLLGFMLNGGNADGGSVATRGTTVPNEPSVNTAGAVVEGPKQFTQCLSDGKYAQAVKDDMQLGASLGVNGTPATFINGYLMSGALPYEALKQVVEAVLADKEPDFDFMKDQNTGELVKVDMPELPNVIWSGNENAKISVVEFSDFECSFCARFAPSIDQLLEEYGDKIRFTYRHFPLSFHPQAQKAAEAFECAKEQGKGFEMHDKLFELTASQQLGTNGYNKAANDLKLK